MNKGERLIFCDFCHKNFDADMLKRLDISWVDGDENPALVNGFSFVLCPTCAASIIKTLQKGKKEV